MKRKYSKNVKLIFGLFVGAVSLVLVLFGFATIKTVSRRAEEQDLAAGNVVYDGLYSAVELEDSVSVEKDSNDQYFLLMNNQKISLGNHTVAYAGTGMRVFGGGYKVDAEGNVSSVTDDALLDFGKEVLVKLADRKYLLIANNISDSNGVFKTNNYLYIILDNVGNAKMFSSSLSLKTTQPTVIHGDTITFDIANEILETEDQSYDMAKVIGSTNTYDETLYKTIEEEQSPEVIDITVKGGDGGDGGNGGNGGDGGDGGVGGDGGDGGIGGNGGYGGVGGNGGDGGTGGNGGDGGTGGDGGNGGVGGDGGDGGDGGRGGDGGTSDEKELVAVSRIKSVSHNSTSIEVEYSIIDPYGSLGIIYLELHEVSKLGNLTIKNLYSDELSDDLQTAVDEYWEKGDFIRTTADVYETSYTFNGLNPNSQYYVVMLHKNYINDGSGSDEMEVTLDDTLKVTTDIERDELTVSSISSDGTIEVNLNISELDKYSDAEEIVIYGEITGEGIITVEYGSVTLTRSDLEDATDEGGCTFELHISENSTKTIDEIQYIKVALAKDNGSGDLLALNLYGQAYNGLYKNN